MRFSVRRRFAASAVIFALAAVLGACSSAHKEDARQAARFLGILDNPDDLPPLSAPSEYKRALALIDEEKYADALEILNDLMIQEPTSAYIQSAAYHSGRALEGLGRWSEAAERYSGVVVACDGIAPRLQAMALYRQSFSAEALGDDPQTVAVLFDLDSRSAALPKEIAKAELPARLAAAYARVGNFDQALDFYRKAEAGIKQLKQSAAASKSQVPSWLPRTLYFMGSMSLRHVNWNEFETAFRPLARSQTYLLESAELGIDPWSARAAKDLIATYRDLWNTLENAQAPGGELDPIAARREVQKKQWDRAVLVIETLTELRARFIPSSEGDAAKSEMKPSPQANEIRQFVADMDKLTGKFLAQRPIGDGGTPESKRRRVEPRGRVLEPDSSLEQRFIESSRSRKDPSL